MTYDVRAVRAHFPALAEGAAHFDSPGGSQTVDVVADAVAETLRAAVANRGTVTAAERRADSIVTDFRQAVADLLGAQPGGVIHGRSMTQLTYDISRTLAKSWGPGDEVVVTRLDHDANIRPWVQAAEAVGATVRWAAFDPATAELATDEVTSLLSPRTRLVAVTGSSNLVGTKPDLASIGAAVHAVDALFYVDGVHLTPHAFIDIEAIGADFFACSPYKFLGPHHGIVAASPALLETLHPDKLLPSTNSVPERFELGTLPYELLAGTTAAIDFLAHLAPGDGSRRERLRTSMAALEAHERAMRDRMEEGLSRIPGVVIHSRAAHRSAQVLFSVTGVDSANVYAELGKVGVNAPAGNFYAIECSRWLGLGDTGAVRAGMAPYTDASDVDRLIAGVAEIAEQAA